MSREQQVVAGSPTGTDDDLLLPRPPGVLRRFWLRHPRLLDALVAVSAFLLSAPTAIFRADTPVPPAPAQVWLAYACVVAGCVALLFRRRRPVIAFAFALVPLLVLPTSLATATDMLLAFAAYALAVYRSARACWIALAVTAGALALSLLTGILAAQSMVGVAISNVVSCAVIALLGALIGINVGGRRRYLEALIDRSRQLAVERDQQAALAAAAERTRIAREMHDIVSHSLTVIVALSEGAAAASSPERARQASRGAADTARGALQEMRAMLGVLRGTGDEASPLEPLEPTDPAEVVEAAQRAGFPVSLTTAGTVAGAPRAVRFALSRVVQEGLTNAMRHSPRATTIEVRIDATGDDVAVRIRNDGVRAGAQGGGFGLRGLRERVEHVGGTLSSGPAGPAAWVLTATLPRIAARTEEDTP